MRGKAPFMAGVPELLVLKVLSGRAMYGYELAQAIRETSVGEIALGEGVIYPLLHMLERDGALKSEQRMEGGRRRVYYAITPSGETRFEGLRAEWMALNQAIRAVLDGAMGAAS